MPETPSDLSAYTRQTLDAANDAVGWIERNKAGIGARSDALHREFRRFRRAARQFQRAAARPSCVGVFGPSQTGKSYLVSALARPPAVDSVPELLRVRLGTELKDFLSQINPEKQQEATGLVTRFTLMPTGAQAPYPVAVRLLSQTDLIKVLANTYLSDFDASKERPPAASEIEQAFNRMQGKAKASPVDVLDADAIDELHVYINEQFAARPTQRALLETNYWERLEDLAPRLPIDDRIKLYSFLWGQLPAFDELYKQLYLALEGLGFAGEAFCPITALIPRATSIIDVAALEGLAEGRGDKLEVLSSSGRTCRISRSHLTAIVAELTFQIDKEPWDYFKHTDLMDFPGARSRDIIFEDPDHYVRKEGSIPYLFRRGKVAYLFDRYREERELTSMILCIQPGNQEVKTLPKMVLNWIHDSHGPTPAQRARVETALFFVLTKFDLRFAESAGAEIVNADERWTAALSTALEEFFGGARDDWPKQWHPGEPFRNTFWLRNPNFLARGLMTYDAKNVETGLLNGGLIAQIKSEYLANELVKRHFTDPDKAWEAAFSLNDGGVTYLARSLAPVCRPELKITQLKERVRDLRANINGKLVEFHVSGDAEAERLKRVAAANEAMDGLATTIEGERFGHFLSKLQLSDDELQSVLRQTKLSNQARALHIEADLTKAAIQYWAGKLQALASDLRVIEFLLLRPETMAVVVRELLAGLQRLEIAAMIEDAIRRVSSAVTTPGVEMVKPAMASAERLNRYVYRLGQDSLPPSQRTLAPNKDGEPEPVFTTPERIDTLHSLPETRRELYYKQFTRDWRAAFTDLATKNASTGSQPPFPPHESKILEEILARVA